MGVRDHNSQRPQTQQYGPNHAPLLRHSDTHPSDTRWRYKEAICILDHTFGTLRVSNKKMSPEFLSQALQHINLFTILAFLKNILFLNFFFTVGPIFTKIGRQQLRTVLAEIY